MLILTRRIGESVVIGDSIKLTVMEASESRIRLGVDAPREISVHREEIYQRIVREKTKDTQRAGWTFSDLLPDLLPDLLAGFDESEMLCRDFD